MFADPPLPLALDILGAVIQQLGLSDPLDIAVLREKLHYRNKRESYLRAVAADGAMRFGLNGQPVEPVSDDHKQQALAALTAFN